MMMRTRIPRTVLLFAMPRPNDGSRCRAMGSLATKNVASDACRTRCGLRNGFGVVHFSI